MQVYGLLGQDIDYSVSPSMQEAGFEAAGIDARYNIFNVDNGDVEDAVKGAEALGIGGLNVTKPYKQDVLELDFVKPDETAGEIGAVNTLKFTDEGVKAYNTDASGALRALEEQEVEVDGSQACIIGAGGAARAIGYILDREGADIHVVNRTLENARELADMLGYDQEHAYHLDSQSSIVPESDIVLNTTPVGRDNVEKAPIETSHLAEHQTVFDAVYTPEYTKLLREAEEIGAETVTGVRMLLHQGTEAFEIWTGENAPEAEMEKALRGALD